MMSAASSAIGDMSFKTRASRTSVRGNKSSLLSPSDSLLDQSPQSPPSPAAPASSEQTPAAASSASAKNNKTNNSTILSVASKASSKPGDFTVEDSRMVSPPLFLDDEPSALVLSGRRSSRAASRRVSFGEAALSPISADPNLASAMKEESVQVEVEVEEEALAWMDEVSDKEESLTSSTREDSDRRRSSASKVNTSASRSRTSISYSRAVSSASRRSSVSSHRTSFAADEEEAELDTSAAATTPFSSASKRGSSIQTPASSFALSTPGTGDFIRGRRLSDTSYHMDSMSEDNSESDSSATTPMVPDRDRGKLAKGKAAKKGGRSSEHAAEDEEGVTENEVSTSFVDQSFLNTISSANKKYVGKKLLEENKRKRLEEEKLKKKRKRSETEVGRESNVDLSSQDEEENFVDSEEEAGARRSRRATKGQRFAFWKNERPIYQEGTMVGLLTAEPTPKKSRRTTTSKTSKASTAGQRLQKGGKGRAAHAQSEEGGEHDTSMETNLPPVKLPKKYRYLDASKSAVFSVWDNHSEKLAKQRIVTVRETMPALRPLPPAEGQKSRHGPVGYAGHTFVIPEVQREMSGWISGYLELPPRAVKDAELVGVYAQLFFVAQGQPGALEFGLADPSSDEWDDSRAQRVVLSPGDSFYVPPGNMYRLENHSESKASHLFFVVVEPISDPGGAVGSSISEATVISS